MKKKMWIFVLVTALLVSGLLPIGVATGSGQSGGKQGVSAVNEYEEIRKEYGSENGTQGVEYTELTTDDSKADAINVTAAVKPTLTLKAPTLEFKDTIRVVAFYTAENIQDVMEMGMITYSTKPGAADIATADNIIPGAEFDTNTSRYFSASQGIHAKYLSDNVYLAIYAKLVDGTYTYSKVASYSAVQYATNQLKNSSDAKLKQLVVAMLNYGAKAQLHFNHNTGSLATAALTADQLALPAAYNSGMVSSVPSAPADKQGIFANNQGFAKRTPSISFEGAFCINYFFTPKYAPDSGITMYYWTAEDYNAASVLTTSNATGKIKLEGSGTGQYQGDIEGIAAKALSEAVYVACAYKSGGTVWTSGVLGYSIGAYCSSQATKAGTIADLAKATAVYGYHAKQFFAISSTEFTVTFKDWDGTVLKTQTVVSGNPATAPEDPSRDGYTFTGWDKSFNAVTTNLTVTATYSQNSEQTYTVTFVDYNGTTLATEVVYPGAAAQLPANPSKSGTTFLGWSGNYTNVTENEIVTAVYSDKKNVFTVESTSGSIGETVTVLVAVDGSVKTCGFDFVLFYSSALELVSYDEDLDLDIIANDAKYTNGIKLNFSAASDKTKQRDIIELTFKIKDTTKTALPIWIDMKEVFEIMSSGTIENAPYTIIDGVVTVE